MNRYYEHQCGEGLGWSDMANVSEPSFDVPLDSELPKMLIGSDQNGKGSQCYFSNVGNTQILQPRDTDWCLSHSQTRKGIYVEHGNVVEPPEMEKVTREGADDSALYER